MDWIPFMIYLVSGVGCSPCGPWRRWRWGPMRFDAVNSQTVDAALFISVVCLHS